MFKNIETIKDVRGFAIQNNILYYLNSKEKLVANNQIVCDAYGIEMSKKALFSYQNIYDVETKIIFDNGNIENTPYSLNANAFNGINTIIYNKDFNDFEKQVGVYDITNKEIKWFQNIQRFGNNIRVENNLYYKQSHTTLKSLSLLTGEYEWEVDLGAYGEIDKIIGVCNEILWVGVGSKMLIGIDIKYGKIMHIIDKPSHFAYQSGAFNYFRGHDGQIDEKAKKIVGFEFDTYYELDLVTMEFTYWIFREEAKAMKIEARYATQNIHIGDYIYFIDKLNAKIGIFDRQNKKIIEAYAFPENSCTGIINDLQVTDNKMYVLDTGGTLHIFEKE